MKMYRERKLLCLRKSPQKNKRLGKTPGLGNRNKREMIQKIKKKIKGKLDLLIVIMLSVYGENVFNIIRKNYTFFFHYVKEFPYSLILIRAIKKIRPNLCTQFCKIKSF